MSHEQDSTESDDEESSDNNDDEVPVISHGDAARFFELCLTWLENQPDATVYNTSVLRELQSLAATKRIQCLNKLNSLVSSSKLYRCVLFIHCIYYTLYIRIMIYTSVTSAFKCT